MIQNLFSNIPLTAYCLALFTVIPASIMSSYVIVVNQADTLRYLPVEEQSISAWILHGHHLYRQILYSSSPPTYRHNERNNLQLTQGWALARSKALSGKEWRGSFSLLHPKILESMAMAFHTPIAKDTFVKAGITHISAAFCWVSVHITS